MDLGVVGADIAQSNEHSDHKDKTHKHLFKSNVYFAPTKKVLVQKDKFPVTTSVTVHVSKIVMLKKKKAKRNKYHLLQQKNINTNKSTVS